MTNARMSARAWTRRHPAAAAAVVLAAAGAVVLPAAAAHAAPGTLSVAGVSIVYTASPGQTNNLVISQVSAVPEVYEFNDGVPISSADPACTHPDPADATRMRCATFGTVFVVVDAGDGNDTVHNATDRLAALTGGPGNDTLTLGGVPGSKAWGSGDGGDGDDVIRSGRSDDYIAGGPGTDTVTYAGLNDPVTARLDLGGGGRWYDHDTYQSIENLTGGGGDDHLYGNGGRNVLDGGAGPCVPRGCRGPSGNDLFYGHGGADTIFGWDGTDEAHGGDGNDVLYGGDDQDMLYGEAGNDILRGEANIHNWLDGGSGYDDCSSGWLVNCEVTG